MTITTYEAALAARDSGSGFKADGVARWPHHRIIFLYPDGDLLPEKSVPVVQLPDKFSRRPAPVQTAPPGVSSPFSCLRLVDTTGTTERQISRANLVGLSNAIDTVSQRTGTTTLKMVTYMHANGSEESVTFRIHRETLKKDNTKVDEKAEDLYEMTEGQFNQLHSGCSDADCGHWWHNLDELWKRSNDRACLEVQDYAVSQELVLSPTAWKQNPKQKPLWDRFEQGLSRYDTSILDQSHILKKDRQIIKIHRDAMTPGVGRLLRAARDVSAEPRRLNPANTQEASVMAEVLEKTIFHSHMWPKEPAEYRDWLRDEVMEALGDTAVPRVDVVRGAHVHVAPGFSEFLDKFVTRLINWYMDPGRSCGRVFKDPKLPPPGKRKAVEEEETEEEGAKRLRKSRRLKGEEVLDY